MPGVAFVGILFYQPSFDCCDFCHWYCIHYCGSVWLLVFLTN